MKYRKGSLPLIRLFTKKTPHLLAGWSPTAASQGLTLKIQSVLGDHFHVDNAYNITLIRNARTNPPACYKCWNSHSSLACNIKPNPHYYATWKKNWVTELQLLICPLRPFQNNLSFQKKVYRSEKNIPLNNSTTLNSAHSSQLNIEMYIKDSISENTNSIWHFVTTVLWLMQPQNT